MNLPAARYFARGKSLKGWRGGSETGHAKPSSDFNRRRFVQLAAAITLRSASAAPERRRRLLPKRASLVVAPAFKLRERLEKMAPLCYPPISASALDIRCRRRAGVVALARRISAKNRARDGVRLRINVPETEKIRLCLLWAFTVALLIVVIVYFPVWYR
jgi:hypothetical protein